MLAQSAQKQFDLFAYLREFRFVERLDLFSLAELQNRTQIEFVDIEDRMYPRFLNEFWTSKQKQASPLHEIAYRACFKPQLPRFFIELLTQEDDIVYDPFSGRGTTIIEAALLARSIISNDINPLSKYLAMPRLQIPDLAALESRLFCIPINDALDIEIDLSMFYHPRTLKEIVSLRHYLHESALSGEEDSLDRWIRMVATNRLTGHSVGFFSVYTLPPNQAVSPASQRRINQKRNQIPEYRDTKAIILLKSRQLLRGLNREQRANLERADKTARFFTTDARHTPEIRDNSVQLVVTSPPFLDVVQYAQDNWLRSWFNWINAEELSKCITTARTMEEWSLVMYQVFLELYRVIKRDGWVAYEVGEIKNGKVKLDEHVVPLGLRAGFECQGILLNEQQFTKTANIWGIKNNQSGTNTNRIVIFQKK